MKKLAVLLSALLLAVGLCFAADPCEGYWVSIDDKTNEVTGGWKIYEKDGVLYGEMLFVAGQPADAKATGATGKSYPEFCGGKDIGSLVMVGPTWIYGLKQKEPGKWTGGNIIDPGSGKRYGCEIVFIKADGATYKVDTLSMAGVVGPIKVKQYWKKATLEQAQGKVAYK